MKLPAAIARMKSIGFIGVRGKNGVLSAITRSIRAGAISGRVPRHEAAPVMADDHAFLDPHRVEHPDQVGDDFALGVGLDRLGTAGLAVAALVGRDRAQTGVASARI